MLLSLLRRLLPGRGGAGTGAAPGAPARRILQDDPGSETIVVRSDHGPIVVSRRDNMIGRSIVETGSWEREEIELLRVIVAERCRGEECIEILDVGANVGVHAVAFAKFALAGLTVHAFEAQQRIFDMLRRTVALNALDNVRCHHCAVADETGRRLSFAAVDYTFESNFGALELEPAAVMDFDGRRVPGAVETVQTLRIDDLALARVRLIKIDVEGMEHKVLAGARATIERCRPVLFIEYLKADFAAIAALLSRLDYVGYDAQRPNLLAVPVELSGQCVAAQRMF